MYSPRLPASAIEMLSTLTDGGRLTSVTMTTLLPLTSTLLMVQIDVLEKQLALVVEGRRLEREAFQTQVTTCMYLALRVPTSSRAV